MNTTIFTAIANEADRDVISKALRQDVAGERQSAWQREMEREQLQTWLRHPLLPVSTAAVQDVAAAGKDLFSSANWSRVSPEEKEGGDKHVNDDGIVTREESNVVNTDGHTVSTADINALAWNNGDAVDTASVNGLSTSRFASMFSLQSQAGIQEDTDNGSNARMTTVTQGLQQLLRETGLASLQLTFGAGPLPTSGSVSERKTAQIPVTDFSDSLDEMGSAEEEKSLGDKKVAGGQQADVNETPLRVHTEATGNAARVWIGADGSLQLSHEKLLQLGGNIQRLLNDNGIALESLTCNGTLVVLGAPRQSMDTRGEKRFVDSDAARKDWSGFSFSRSMSPDRQQHDRLI